LNSQNVPKILPKVLAKLSGIFRLLPEQFSAPQKKLLKNTNTMLYDIFIFVKIEKLKPFLPKF